MKRIAPEENNGIFGSHLYSILRLSYQLTLIRKRRFPVSGCQRLALLSYY